MKTPSLAGLSSAVVLTLALATGVAGCGGSSSSDAGGSEATGAETSGAETSSGEGLDKAVDEGTCSDEATPLDQASYGDTFPADWPFPAATVVYGFEDRGSSGAIVTAVTATPFQDVLDFMNQDVVSAGFEIEQGETEEHDAEAEWRGTDFHGRWAIRDSSTCPGETVIQVLAGPN